VIASRFDELPVICRSVRHQVVDRYALTVRIERHVLGDQGRKVQAEIVDGYRSSGTNSRYCRKTVDRIRAREGEIEGVVAREDEGVPVVRDRREVRTEGRDLVLEGRRDGEARTSDSDSIDRFDDRNPP
jgi:hypothetical protein